MTQTNHRISYGQVAFGLCLLAGVLYNSWPLGFMLDNATAHHALASDLELIGHPYYWLFILGDLLTAACIIAAAIIARFYLWHMPDRAIRTRLLLGLVLFSVFTVASSLLPYRCSTAPLALCGAIHASKIGLDAITSSLAWLGLLVSLGSLAFSDKLHPWMRQLVFGTLIIWLISAGLFVVTALRYANWAYFVQFALMITTGLTIVVIGSHFYLSSRPH